MTPQTIIAAITAVALFALGFHGGQAWRQRDVDKAQAKLAQAQAQHAQAQAQAAEKFAQSLAKAHDQEQAWQAAAHQAEAHSAELRKQIDVAARSADGAAQRLRNESRALTGTLNRLSADAVAARQRLADTLSDVVGECGGRLAEVAREADRRESERRALIEGWPR